MWQRLCDQHPVGLRRVSDELSPSLTRRCDISSVSLVPPESPPVNI